MKLKSAPKVEESNKYKEAQVNEDLPHHNLQDSLFALHQYLQATISSALFDLLHFLSSNPKKCH